MRRGSNQLSMTFGLLLRRFLVAACVSCTLVATESAHALSCVGIDDRFFTTCASGQCSVAFRARDVPAPGACARRTVVEAVPTALAEVLLSRVSKELMSGDYEITLTHRYYAEPPVSAQELKQALDAPELRALSVRLAPLPADTGMTQLREEWTNKAHRSLADVIVYWAIELALAVAALYLLYRTMSTYRQRLRRTSPTTLRGPLAVQSGLFLVGCLSLVSPTWPALLGLVAPLVLLAWAFEIGTYVWARRRGPASQIERDETTQPGM